MTEDEARAWLTREQAVPRETMAKLEAYVGMLLLENSRQNLIASSTVPMTWARHIVDSAQLRPLLREGSVIDVGSGAGLPGIVLAILGANPVLLVEPRRRRAEFLSSCVEKLGLDARVRQARIESVACARAATIVARALAPLPAIFASAAHLAGDRTRWILPKGRNVHAELAAASDSWQGDFRIVPSVTDSAAAIVVAENVRRRAREGAGG